MSTIRHRRFIRLASLAGVSLGLGRLGGIWHALPPKRPKPPVHRKRYSRTNHTGHNKEIPSQIRISRRQGTAYQLWRPPNKQGPCGQADAPHVQLEATLGEVAGGLWAGQHRGNTITSSQYYISAEALCNGTRAPRATYPVASDQRKEVDPPEAPTRIGDGISRAGGDDDRRSRPGRMPNAKSIGWAIYAAGFAIWLFGCLSAGHAPAFDGLGPRRREFQVSFPTSKQNSDLRSCSQA